jgi:hypothetical protein
MTSISLTVDDRALARIRHRAERRGFASPEAYLQSLLAEDLELEQSDHRALEPLLLERIDQPTIEMTPDEFRRLNSEIESEILAGRRP